MTKNSALTTLSVMDTVGHLKADTQAISDAMLRNSSLINEDTLHRFKSEASPAEISDTAALLGIDNFDAATLSEIQSRAAQFAQTDDGQALAAQRRRARAAAESDIEARALPHILRRNMADGMYRYSDSGLDMNIIKEGESYFIFDRETGIISKPQTVQSINRIINQFWKLKNSVDSSVNSKVDGAVFENSPRRQNTDNRQISANLGDNAANFDISERSAAAEESTIQQSDSDGVELIVLDTNSELYKELKADDEQFSTALKKYIVKKYANKDIVFSDGTRAIVDNTDAKELSKRAGKTKVAEISQLDELIAKARNIGTDSNATHKKFDAFTYFRVKVDFDGKIHDILLNVGHGKFDSKNHLYAITNYNKNRAIAGNKSLSGSVDYRIKSDDSNNNISQKGEKINTFDEKSENSQKNESESSPAAVVARRLRIKRILEQVSGTEKLGAPAMRAVENTVRQALAHGFSEADALSCARVAARSGLNIVFDAEIAAGDDARIRGNTIYISPDADEARLHSRLLLHEVGHALFRGSRRGQRLAAEAFRSIDPERSSKIAEKYIKRYRDRGYKLEKYMPIVNEEITMHHIEDVLGSTEAWDYILSEEPSAKEKILSFFRRSARDYSADEKLSSASRKLLRQYKKMFDEFAARNVGNNAPVVTRMNSGKMHDKDERAAIVVLENGKKYVKANMQVIKGDDQLEWAKQVADFINREIRNWEDFSITTDEGDILTITKDTAYKAGSRNSVKNSDGTYRQMTNSEYETKLNAEIHINELAEISQKTKKPVQTDTKKHRFAKDGFTYRTAYFEDFDGQYYEVTLSVGNNGTVATVYNVGKIKTGNVPPAKIMAVVGSQPPDTLPITSVPRKSEIVKKNSKNISDERSAMHDKDERAAEKDKKKITVGMSDSERTEILRNTEIKLAEYKGNSEDLNSKNVLLLKNSYKSQAQPILKALGEKFKVFKWRSNENVSLDFDYSRGSLNESIHKQNEITTDFYDFAKMLYVFDDLVANAVPIEVHTDKYVGTARENTNLKYDYVLLSAFKDGNYVVPVEFHIKEMKETSGWDNKLYISITLGKIKIEDGVMATISEGQRSNQTKGANPSSTISIPHLIEKINPEYGNFYKYFPSGMLDEAQNRSKSVAVKDENYRLATMRGEDVSDILRKKAEEKGYSNDNSWKMDHTAPNSIDGYSNSMDKIDKSYNSDGSIYSPKAVYYYGEGRSYDKKAIAVIRSARNNPEKLITVYRAVPSNVKESRMRNGDWVAIVKEYAAEHGERMFDGDYRIIESTVPAKELFSNGDSINEWGYDNGNPNEVYKNTENNVKLLEPTYDDGGQLIPLSKRFDSNIDDERYAIKEDIAGEAGDNEQADGRAIGAALDRGLPRLEDDRSRMVRGSHTRLGKINKKPTGNTLSAFYLPYAIALSFFVKRLFL